MDGDPGRDGRIVFDLANVAGNGYAMDASGKPISLLLENNAESPVNRTAGAPFRLHAIFQPNLEDTQNTPILDPLALDDVTVYYDPPGGAGLTDFGEGE